jgi:predicted NBD/HSP70 family sugar kinase
LSPAEGPALAGKTDALRRSFPAPGCNVLYADISGEERKLPEIVSRATSGEDQHATATMDRLKEYFARGVAVILNIVDPDAIVIGGGVGNLDLLYGSDVRDEILKHLFNSTF